MSNYSLRFYNRVAQSTTGYLRRSPKWSAAARDWTRSIGVIGGFLTGDFTLLAEDLGTRELIDIYQDGIGWRIEERTGSILSWEGEIVQMDLTIGGMTYRRTLDPQFWHNKVKVQYGVDTGTDETAYSEETGSSDTYGESCLIEVAPSGFNATSAAAMRDRLLTQGAYPASRAIGGFASDKMAAPPDGLHVTCAGYVFSMNRRYQETDIAAGNASAQLATLAAASEFVTAGRIHANTLQVAVNVSHMPTRLWDACRTIIEQGDASGNRWIGGVEDGRKFYYWAAQTIVSHYWKRGRLTQRGGAVVPPSLIRPGIIMQIVDAPLLTGLPNAGVWENPRNVYVEEVEFIAPDGFRLIPRE